jgi:hypothetical protein
MSGIVFLESSFRVFVPLEKDYAHLTGSFKKHFPNMKFSAQLHAKGIYLGYYWTFSFKDIAEMNAFMRMYNIPSGNDKLEEESKIENIV